MLVFAKLILLIVVAELCVWRATVHTESIVEYIKPTPDNVIRSVFVTKGMWVNTIGLLIAYLVMIALCFYYILARL